MAGIISIGVDLESSKRSVELADKYAIVFAAVGIHPTECADVPDRDFDVIEELAQHEKVVAIGEIGLDYYHMRAPKTSRKMSSFTSRISLKTRFTHNRPQSGSSGRLTGTNYLQRPGSKRRRTALLFGR